MTIGIKSLSDSQISDVLIKILGRFEGQLSDDEKFSLTCAFNLFTQRSCMTEAFKEYKAHSLGFLKCENK